MRQIILEFPLQHHLPLLVLSMPVGLVISEFPLVIIPVAVYHPPLAFNCVVDCFGL